jgi:hypothetical protein
MENQITVFEQKQIRRTELIGTLTDSPTPQNYWAMLKKREPQLLTICEQLKMLATDGRKRLTDCANTEGSLFTKKTCRTA